MHVLLERFIISSTPAWRVLLAVFFSTPFFVLVLIAGALALSHPAAHVGMNTRVVMGMQMMLLVSTAINVSLALWLWPHRDLPEPVPVATLLVCQVIGLTYTVTAILAGTFTTGTSVILIGVLAVGLLLFEQGPMLVSFFVCIGTMLLHDLGVIMGWWRYAPALRSNVFVGLEPVWWFMVWRQFVFWAGYIVLLSLLLLLFARLDAMHAKLTRLSYTDGLTGLANRRRFMEVLHNEVARQARTGQPLCLVLIDADHFKQVNDAHGHAMGDEVLRMLGRLLMGCVRCPTDLACRLGGEEFGLILPDTRPEHAQAVCGRLRERLAQHEFGQADVRFRITVSMGVVACTGTDAEANLRQADRQLYLAKAAGRNRVSVADFAMEAP